MNFFENFFKNKYSKKALSLLLLIFFSTPLIALAVDPLGDPVGFVTGALSSVTSGMALDVGKGILGMIVSSLNTMSIWILELSLSFLSWTASGDFIQAGMMTSMDNPLISTGWTATRNIANIMLIFGLVAIAISIMLEYQETKAKKMLVNFFWIALLINFTPVICNTLIDAANILMNIFLKGGVSPQLVAEIQNKQKTFSLEDLPTLVCLFVFALLASFMYILYGLLFMFRYIQLWILIIISPIAFATYVFLPTNAAQYLRHILPAQCEWKTWWSEFLNWTFIGVPAAFSIYLSNILMQSVAANPHAIVSAPSGALAGTFSLIFSFMIPFGVLVEGFMMTMSKGGNAGGTLKGWYSKGTGLIKTPLKKKGEELLTNAGSTIKQGGLGLYHGLTGSKDAIKQSYDKRVGDLDASGGNYHLNRLRGAGRALGRAGIETAKGGVGGGAADMLSRTNKKQNEKDAEQEKLENGQYNEIKNLDMKTIKNIANSQNTSTPLGAAQFSAALRVLQENDEAIPDAIKTSIKANPSFKKSISRKGKEAVIKNDLSMANEFFDIDDKKMNSYIVSAAAEKGKINEEIQKWINSHVDSSNANDIIDKKSREEAMKRVPTLAGRLTEDKDRDGRADEQIMDDNLTKMGPGDLAKIQTTIALGNIHILKHLNDKQVKKMVSSADSKVTNKLIEQDDLAKEAHTVLSGGTTTAKVPDMATAQDILNIYEGLDELIELNKIISGATPATLDQKLKATETRDDLVVNLGIRTRHIAGNRP